MAAREKLEAEGIPTAVVSMPRWELFAEQTHAYRTEVLGESDNRVAVEAAVGFGWERWIGTKGRFVGMSTFGASGPADKLYQHFGITVEAVVAAAK